MCRSCFRTYDKPEFTDAARAVAKKIEAVYEIHSTGGAGHIVFDGWNIDDVYVESCIDLGPDEATKDALVAFRALSMPERNAAMAIHWGMEDEEHGGVEE